LRFAEYGGEACIQVRLSIGKGDDRPRRFRQVVRRIEMHVRIDHARQHGRGTQIDHLRTRRYCHAGADVTDAVAPDDDHLIRQQRAGAAVEHPAGANRNHLRRRCHEARRRAALRMDDDAGQKHGDSRDNALQMLHGLLRVFVSSGCVMPQIIWK